MPQNVLLIDDDIELCAMLTEYLAEHEYVLTSAHRGDDGLRSSLGDFWDLILLDVMLPGMDGFEVLRQLRATSSVPVLLLTARSHEVDRIVGLELGADDYLPKPFNVRELVARMRAILRRNRGTSTAQAHVITVGNLRLDEQERKVTFNRSDIFLTDVEYRIFELLMRSPGTIISREQIARHTHGRSFSTFNRSLDMHVSRLRRKLEFAGMPTDQFRTVRGEGYLLINSAGAYR